MNKKERKNKKTKNSFVNLNSNNQLLTSKSGITLIALILTIIILLLLAMVSISYIMRENIIKHAETAVNQYQIEAEKEAIELAYEEYVMDGLNDKNANLNMEGQATVTDHQDEDGNNNGWNVKFESSGNEYTVDKYGNITGPTTGGSSTGGSSTGGSSTGGSTGGGSTGGGSEPQKSNLPDINGKQVGDEILWDGDGNGETESWIVLSTTDTETEIISKDSMGSLTLGAGVPVYEETYAEDSYVNWEDKTNVINEADLDKNGSLDEIEKAIYSYNHAIETINNYCKDLIKSADRENVRSIGRSSETDEYTENYLDKFKDKYNNLKVGNINYKNSSDIDDWKKMNAVGLINSNYSDDVGYWIAERWEIYTHSTQMMLGIPYVIIGSEITETQDLIKFTYDGTYETHSKTCGVRPIVTIKTQ